MLPAVVAGGAVAVRDEENIMSKQLQLINRVLGMDPFVLVQITGVDEDGMQVEVEFGGGPTADDVRNILMLALSQMGPLSDDEVAELQAGG